MLADFLSHLVTILRRTCVYLRQQGLGLRVSVVAFIRLCEKSGGKRKDAASHDIALEVRQTGSSLCRPTPPRKEIENGARYLGRRGS